MYPYKQFTKVLHLRMQTCAWETCNHLRMYIDLMIILSIIIIDQKGILSYSYITVGVGFLCYYMSPRQSRGQVLIQRYPMTTLI